VSLVAYTSESMAEGHPDKVCDQISDAILDRIIEKDRYARVACETLIATGLVVVAGEITTDCYVDITGTVRDAVKRIGYDDPSTGFDYRTCAVMVMLEEQSEEIAIGVDRKGAGDQGIMVGYATNEGESLPEPTEYMPVPIHYAHKLCRTLAEVRKTGELPFLRPDGKAQVTVQYEDGVPRRISHVVVAAQHNEDVSIEELRRAVQEKVVERVLGPSGLISGGDYECHINATGAFSQGGPRVDVGLTGRKIIADTYGIASRHGGAAFSGKDPTKTDRSASYAARYVAKNIVAAGMADRCEVQLAYVIGLSDPVSLTLDTFGTEKLKTERILEAVKSTFNLTPPGIIETLDLRRPVFSATSVYGHFGKTGPEFTWENCDQVEKLKSFM